MSAPADVTITVDASAIRQLGPQRAARAKVPTPIGSQSSGTEAPVQLIDKAAPVPTVVDARILANATIEQLPLGPAQTIHSFAEVPVEPVEDVSLAPLAADTAILIELGLQCAEPTQTVDSRGHFVEVPEVSFAQVAAHAMISANAYEQVVEVTEDHDVWEQETIAGSFFLVGPNGVVLPGVGSDTEAVDDVAILADVEETAGWPVASQARKLSPPALPHEAMRRHSDGLVEFPPSPCRKGLRAPPSSPVFSTSSSSWQGSSPVWRTPGVPRADPPLQAHRCENVFPSTSSASSTGSSPPTASPSRPLDEDSVAEAVITATMDFFVSVGQAAWAAFETFF